MVFLEIPNVPKGTVFAGKVTYVEIYEEFNKANIFWIAHTEQEIGVII